MCALDTKDLILKLGNWCWIMSEHWSILTLNYSPKKDHCSNTVKDLFNSIEIKYFWVDCSILLEFSQFLDMLWGNMVFAFMKCFSWKIYFQNQECFPLSKTKQKHCTGDKMYQLKESRDILKTKSLKIQFQLCQFYWKTLLYEFTKCWSYAILLDAILKA